MSYNAFMHWRNSEVKERFPRATDDDIIEAWAIGAGGGCEFEWPME